MTAHVVFAALDPEVPATLSPRVITELLRGELGYQGVIISDDLDMKAVASHFGVGDAAVRAIAAGCDVLLLCRNPEHQQQAFDALVAKGTADPTLRQRIADAAERVRKLKLEQPRAAEAVDRSAIGSARAEELAAQLRG
jgi:beta-N-acetylhexosaminidase